MAAADARIVRSLALLRSVTAFAAVLVGCAVLVGGWAFGNDALKGVLPGFSTMKPNTAAAIVMLGAGLAMTAGGRASRAFGATAAVLAVFVGLATLAEYSLGWNAGIDQVFFKDVATLPAAFPGRPAPATAVMIALLGAALLCAHRPALHPIRTFAALLATLIAWADLNSIVFGAEAMRTVPFFSSTAIHTAAVMLVLGIGILAVEPVFSPVRMVFASGAGGIVSRWLLPPAILAPPFLGWLLTRPGALDLFPAEVDWALYALASSLGSVFLIMLLAHRITLIDVERSAAMELSRHDPLTGLANRRAFDSFLLENFNLAKRHGHALSLIMFDVDRFKSYNDAYGHPAGDDLLRTVGMLLSSLVRVTDVAARIGGEEFAIVLPETDLAGAQILAERARLEVERSTLFRRGMTVSVGVAAMTDLTADISALVQDCDAALYRAKAGGRNRVSGGSEPAPRAGAIVT